MEYSKPALIAVGDARAVVLGILSGDGDTGGSSNPTRPKVLALGLDD